MIAEIIGTIGEIPSYNFPKANCKFYEPQADLEGICVVSPSQRIISRLGGCDNPENCAELNRYLKSIRK